DDRGRKFGFELTIFRYGVEQPISGGSAWDINDIYFAHFALADVSGHRFVYDDRAGRGALGEAGAATGDERAWVGDWRIGRDARGEFDIVASDGGDALDLVLAPSKAATPNGRDGTFADGSCATCLARYYSFTRLAASGTLRVDGQAFRVRGTAWHDHEWGAQSIEPGLAGWDWFSIQLDDGIDVMLYRLRARDGSTLAQSSGTFVDAAGGHRVLPLAAFSIAPLGWWASPRDGTRYPSGWTVDVPASGIKLTVTPMLADQELDTAHSTQVIYWEGAVSVRGVVDGHAVTGVGYTELTGYANGGAGDVR
ncbi:MAG TPA: lipocalin family protein, partial [Candidatus Eremiobacteraceae bacterium]|nr:lipocalin family protein [Candidatus Eremiobacteraceae bacterium]